MGAKNISMVLILKLIMVVLTAYLAIKFVPYLGFFPYKGILDTYPFPEFIRALANFDGIHYLLIAKNGYSQYEQAFFPLYPLLIRFLALFLGNNELLAGLLISNLSFALGAWIFLKTFAQKKTTKWLLLFLLTFPTAFYFHTVYTEGLFFLLVCLTFFYCQKQQLSKAAIFAFLASLTRLMGLFLVIPIVFTALKHKQKASIFWVFSPIFGLLIYMAYLWQSTGDPLFFFNSQPVFGANRSTSIITLPQVYWRYGKIFFTANWSFAYFIALVEAIMFSFGFLICLLCFKKHYQNKQWFLMSLDLFSITNLLLPTLTGTFSSVPRYLLLSLSIYIYLANLNNRAVKIAVLWCLAISQAVLLSFFVQGYFVS